MFRGLLFLDTVYIAQYIGKTLKTGQGEEQKLWGLLFLGSVSVISRLFSAQVVFVDKKQYQHMFTEEREPRPHTVKHIVALVASVATFWGYRDIHGVKIVTS